MTETETTVRTILTLFLVLTAITVVIKAVLYDKESRKNTKEEREFITWVLLTNYKNIPFWDDKPGTVLINCGKVQQEHPYLYQRAIALKILFPGLDYQSLEDQQKPG